MPHFSSTASTVVALLCFSFISPAHAVPEWHKLTASPVNGFRHDDTYFLNPSLGWVVNTAGFIYKTTDGGASWITLRDQPNATFRCVGFADEMTGWVGNLTIGASCFGTPGDPTLLFATTDGGTSWSSVDNIPEPRPQGLCGMWVTTPSIVTVVGRVCDTPRMIRTTDGGATWGTFDLSDHADRLIDCYFPSATEGFIAAGRNDAVSGESHAVVLHTTDAGLSWTARHTSSFDRAWCWKISFPSPTIGYVSVQSNGAHPPTFLKTTDGGATWTEKPFVAGAYFEQAIGFVNETDGWIGGSAETYRTTDGGDSWSVDNFQASQDDNVNRIRVLTPTLAYAVGRKVYKYFDDTVVAVPLPADEGATEPRLIGSAQPNPFRTHTDIPFSVPATGHVRLIVYDVLGREVAELVNETRAGGTYTERFPAEHLPAAVYVVRLETPGAVDNRKIQLVR